MASVMRKTLSEVGTRLPSSSSTPRANAMSVAAGIAQPCSATGSRWLNAIYTSAGAIIPPTAAMAGSTACDGFASAPSSASRFNSRPTRKKNTAINPSLIHSNSGLKISNSPKRIATGVSRNAA
jgi:hypothetical protein